MKQKRFWLTVFNYGDSKTVCSKHRTMAAAAKAARKCAKMGGAKHVLWLVYEHGINMNGLR